MNPEEAGKRDEETVEGGSFGRGEFRMNGQTSQWNEREKGSREDGLPVPGLRAPP